MSEKITFKELVQLIAKQSEQSESSANSFIHELVQIIEGGLKQSGSVSISGFGKFELRWMKERPGVNPQTGDEITIPGQNKVVFKPFKALRETVNKPFENLEPEVLSDVPDVEKPKSEEREEDSEQFDDDPFGLEGVFGTDAPFDSEDPFDSDNPTEDDYETSPFDNDEEKLFESFEDPFEADEPVPGTRKEPIDDLIFERENPHFGKKQVEFLEEDGDVLVIAQEEKIEEVEKKPERKPKVAPIIPDESKMAKEVQKSGSFKWSYAAAVIIVMIALIILFLMMQRGSEPSEQLTDTNEPTEQVIEEPSAANETAEQEADSEESQPTEDEESPPPDDGDPPQNDLETETFTVQSGQSLWDIAESQLGNPYLWPVIYHLNQDSFNNPNQLLANANIEVPTFSDPDNLSEFEREQVALGYFSLYQWNRENNPDEAQYFLWAVGVFSQDLLDQPPSEVDSQDLAFARNR